MLRRYNFNIKSETNRNNALNVELNFSDSDDAIEVNESFTDDQEDANKSNSDWPLFDHVRAQDIRLLKTLNVGTIVDFMVEKKKVKFGLK